MSWNGSDCKRRIPDHPKNDPRSPKIVGCRIIIFSTSIIFILGIAFLILKSQTKVGNAVLDSSACRIKTNSARTVRQGESPSGNNIIERGSAVSVKTEVETMPTETLVKPGVIYAIDPDEKAKRKVEPISKTAIEEELEVVFSTEVGDRPPIGLPNITARDLKHLTEILISKNEIRSDDPEDVKERKQIVDFAKQEFKKFIKNGGEPTEFVSFYQEELQLAYDKRMDAQRSIMKILKNGGDDDPDLLREYVARVDKMLMDQGIKPTIHSKRLREILGESFENTKEQQGTQQ